MDIVDSEDSLIGVDSIDRLIVWTMKTVLSAGTLCTVDSMDNVCLQYGKYGEC